MSAETNSRQKPGWIFAALPVLALCAWAIYSQQQDNQIVRPFPNANPAPVVPDLPDIIGKLREAKANCEDRAAAAIQLSRKSRIAGKEIPNGRQLYSDTKAASDRVISFLQAGLVRRFRQEDPDKVRELLRTAADRQLTFLEWANRLDRRVGTELNWDELLKAVQAWMNGLNEQNEAAIERLRRDLDECRLRDWIDIERAK